MSDRTSLLREELLRYLAANPRARDTAEGIGWWLRDHEHSAAELRAVLDELTASGFLDST